MSLTAGWCGRPLNCGQRRPVSRPCRTFGPAPKPRGQRSRRSQPVPPARAV